jgi:hypothetical protein
MRVVPVVVAILWGTFAKSSATRAPPKAVTEDNRWRTSVPKDAIECQAHCDRGGAAWKFWRWYVGPVDCVNSCVLEEADNGTRNRDGGGSWTGGQCPRNLTAPQKCKLHSPCPKPHIGPHTVDCGFHGPAHPGKAFLIEHMQEPHWYQNPVWGNAHMSVPHGKECGFLWSSECKDLHIKLTFAKHSVDRTCSWEWGVTDAEISTSKPNCCNDKQFKACFKSTDNPHVVLWQGKYGQNHDWSKTRIAMWGDLQIPHD